ncbi:MAG TPA: sterol desaturase family protein [Gemmataceae bacterium]|jgi:sterol desaturase/sphingolipid hydroxylase (fatty acid hydroxylase superfamily)|nr:sterol desaturase family protein [Gemmataceae bacterium]
MMELFKDSLTLAITMPVCLVLIAIEIVVSHWHDRHYYTFKGTLTNVGLAAVNVGLDVALRAFWFAALAAVFQFHLVDLPGGPLYWIGLLVLQDFLFYWLHRVDHACRLFWAVHSTHHSAGEFNLTVGFRPSVLQPVYRFAWFLPLALVGFRPEDVLLMYSATQLYGVLVHTQYIGRVRMLEWVLCTPSLHRVHHGVNLRYRDKNLGMVFIVWDRLLGTFAPETEEVRFGRPGPANPLRVIGQEWLAIVRDLRRPASLRDRFMYLFGPPGWRPAPSAPTLGARP